jgi:predicted RNA binding protein YcfA (HicA-like mRNA interferase family)
MVASHSLHEGQRQALAWARLFGSASPHAELYQGSLSGTAGGQDLCADCPILVGWTFPGRSSTLARAWSHGFAEVRQRGSYKQFRHPAGRTTTVPFHAGRDISPALLRKIAADIHVTVDEVLSAR